MKIYNKEFTDKVFELIPEANYIVVTPILDCYWFNDKPDITYSNWVRPGVSGFLGTVDLQGKDWKASLVERKWVPKFGENYYVSYQCYTSKFLHYKWNCSSTDNYRLENNMVFRTPEEAIACTDKILEFLAKEKNNE